MQVGDWVEVNGELAMLDYISDTTSWNPVCRVIFASNSEESHRVLMSDLELTESSLTSEDYQMLQVFAVDTNDQEWFSELGCHIKEEVQ